LLNGKATANAKVAENLFKIATGTGREADSAGIIWLKCQARWQERQIAEIQDGTEQKDKLRELQKEIQRTRLNDTQSAQPRN